MQEAKELAQLKRIIIILKKAQDITSVKFEILYK